MHTPDYSAAVNNKKGHDNHSGLIPCAIKEIELRLSLSVRTNWASRVLMPGIRERTQTTLYSCHSAPPWNLSQKGKRS